MKKIKKIIHEEYEVPKYELRISTLDHSDFIEATAYDQDENIKIFFNKNHSGLQDFDNFLKAEERWFEEENELYELAKELNLPEWTVISFYQENGYQGVYSRTGDDALTVKCNNSVRWGRDGFLFIIFAKDKETINIYGQLLNQYINFGFYELSVYDNEDEEFIEYYSILLDKDLDSAKPILKEIYGFTEEDFNNLTY